MAALRTLPAVDATETDLALTTIWDSTLDVGQAVTDPAIGVTIATLSSSIDARRSG